MPRRSTILDHPQRAAIDGALAAGEGVKAVARRYGLNHVTLWRYTQRAGQIEPASTAALDPVATFTVAFGHEPTDYQVAVLTDHRSSVLLKSRQCGASTAAAALAIWTVRSRAGADAVIVSPSLQQSKEVAGRCRNGLYAIEEPLVQDSTSLIRLQSGSRIVSLPGNQRAVRGYSPTLVIADEAAWIEDDTYAAIRPLLAASGGRLVAQSTPGHAQGWFYDLWQSELDDWLRLKVVAEDVPFIDPEFLERERRELPVSVFSQEYGGEFGAVAAALGGLFTDDLIERSLVDDDAVRSSWR